MNSKSNSNFFSIIHLTIIPFGFFMIFYIIFLGIKDIENYSTPSYIPLVSFIISVIYFSNIGYTKITKSLAKPNIKSNLRGIYLAASIIVNISCSIYWILANSILSPISDILTIIAIVLTLSVEFITDTITKFAEKK